MIHGLRKGRISGTSQSSCVMLRSLALLVAVAGASACANAGGGMRPRIGQGPRRSMSAPALALAAFPLKSEECAVEGEQDVLRMRGGGKPTVLVTGGAGYIGTHTAVALQEAGYEVFLPAIPRIIILL